MERDRQAGKQVPAKSEDEAEPKPKPSEPDPMLRTVPDPLPEGDLLVAHACFHSMQPWGEGFWSKSTTFDVTKGVVRLHERKSDGKPVEPGDSPAETTTSSEVVLSETKTKELREAVDRVLGGGPYRVVHAVPEGISCGLELRIG